MNPVAFFVSGEPKAQPRARAAFFAGRAHMYTPSSAKEWTRAVMQAARAAERTFASQPLELGLDFVFQRPASHFGTGKNADRLKSSAPLHHTAKPDCDNLAKAVMDALTSCGTWDDDRQVIRLAVTKRWAAGKGGWDGCLISISPENGE